MGVGSGLGAAASVSGAAAGSDSSQSASDDELDDLEVCILCLDVKPTHVCVPCGHRTLRFLQRPGDDYRVPFLPSAVPTDDEVIIGKPLCSAVCWGLSWTMKVEQLQQWYNKNHHERAQRELKHFLVAELFYSISVHVHGKNLAEL